MSGNEKAASDGLPPVVFVSVAIFVGIRKSIREGKRDIIPFSPATLWRRVKAGEFPAPVKLSAGLTA